LVLANQEEGGAGSDAPQEAGHAEVAAGHPQVTRVEGVQDVPQQGPLLRGALFAREDVLGQAGGGVEDHQAEARQRPGAVPAGFAAGTVQVTVTTPNGTSATSGASQFQYVSAAAPAVTTLTPAFGPMAGGTSVALQGVVDPKNWTAD